MFVLNQRNFIFNINDFNIKQQRRSILLKNDKIKINKLNEYYNNQKILNDWITQIKIYFVFNHIFNEKKFLFVSTFLKKKTKKWFKFILKIYLKNDENSKNVHINFTIFKIKIRNFFNVFDEKQTTKKAIQYLIQKISTTKYATTF